MIGIEANNNTWVGKSLRMNKQLNATPPAQLASKKVAEIVTLDLSLPEYSPDTNKNSNQYKN